MNSTYSFDEDSNGSNDSYEDVKHHSFSTSYEDSLYTAKTGPPSRASAVAVPTPQLSFEELRKTRRNPFPRILKSDVRLILPQMFVNVANSCDGALLTRFFTDLCLGNCQFFDYAKHPISRDKRLLLSNDGIQNFLSFLGGGSAPPDFTCTLKSYRIKRLPYNSNSLVTCTLLIRGTDLASTFFMSHCDAEHRQEAEEMISICRDMYSKSNCDLRDACLKGVVTLVLDNNSQITRMNFMSSFVVPTLPV